MPLAIYCFRTTFDLCASVVKGFTPDTLTIDNPPWKEVQGDFKLLKLRDLCASVVKNTR